MKTRNKSYWKKRTTALEQSIQDGATPSVNNIIRAYERAIDNINGDIRKVFREFSRASGISEEQAAEIISQSESDELYTDLLKLLDETEDAQLHADIITKINSQAYGARISRLEALKRKVYIRLKQAQNTEMSQHNVLHKETLQRSYYSNIYNIAKGFDVGINFSLLPDNAIQKVLSEPWLGSNYSKRIWNNNEQFIERVQQTIEDGITGGHSISRMADKLEEYVKVPNQGQRYITERLARSETAHFMAQGQLMSYEEIGIEKYQYVAALAENTCDTCGGLDGETFDVKDARPGDNYPPMHANCRCTTIMAGFTPATRIARDPETGKNYKVDGNMTFIEWKNSLTDQQREVLKYVDKSAGNGIIKNIEINNIYPSSYNGTVTKEVAEKINAVLKERHASDLFNDAKIVKIQPEYVLQTDTVKNGTFCDVVLNINENVLGGKTVKEIDSMFSNAASTVANSLRDGVIHEEYHARLIHGLNYAQVELLYDTLAEIHIDGISKIAYSDGAECIAETGVLIARGEIGKIPKEAMELFERYIGGKYD